MNSYATEQLTRQRHDHFAREADGDRLARSAARRQPCLGQSRLRRVGDLMQRLSGTLLAGISRPMRPWRRAADSPVGSRATDPRRA